MNFDRVAPFYRGLEWLVAGEKMQRCRVAWLGEVTQARQVLIVGEGPGRFLPECARMLPQAEILCVDRSRGMLLRAQRSLKKIGADSTRVHFLQASLPEWQPPAGKFDLIITHFFLDCFTREQLTAIIGRLAVAAQPQAQWLLSDFSIPVSGVAGWRAKFIVAFTYAFFRIVAGVPASQLISPNPSLEQHGFHLQNHRSYDRGLLHSEIWARQG